MKKLLALLLLLICNNIQAQYIEPIDSVPMTPPTGTPQVAELFLPNIMTPNGDGLNDVLHIGNLEEYDTKELIVYNRWGAPVYRNDDYQNDWDGGNVAHGVYFYVIYVKNRVASGECKGTITIIQ